MPCARQHLEISSQDPVFLWGCPWSSRSFNRRAGSRKRYPAPGSGALRNQPDGKSEHISSFVGHPEGWAAGIWPWPPGSLLGYYAGARRQESLFAQRPIHQVGHRVAPWGTEQLPTRRRSKSASRPSARLILDYLTNIRGAIFDHTAMAA